MNGKFNDRKKIVFLALFMVMAFGIVIWTIFFLKGKPELNPKSEIETNAIALEGEEEKKMDAPKGGGAVSLRFEREIKVSLENQKVELFFQNPSCSVNALFINVIVVDGENEVVIAQSGKVPPGYEVTELTYEADEELLTEGVYEGRLLIGFYDTDKDEKSMVQSNLPDMEITVTQ